MNSKHRRLALFILLAIFLALLVFLARFLWHRHLYAVTNAVFVETDALVFTSFDQVNGRIVKLYRREGDRVRKGEPLAEIDNSTYALRVRELEAGLSALRERARALSIEIKRLRREITLREARAENEIRRIEAERRALIGERKALREELAQAERDFRRFSRLYRENLIPRHRLEEAELRFRTLRAREEALSARVESLSAALEAARKEKRLVQNSRKLVREKEKELSALRARIEAREQALAEARLLLARCRLTSPVSGYIAKRFHAEGDVVGPGEPVYAVVDFSKLYVLVLLEETKLRGVKPGCEARIKIDAYPDRVYRGVVTAVLPATAAKFALVPRDISAGEFTKVAQRVPVKIRITQGDLSLLRVGLGGEVEIRRKF
ncbi:HlyD family secretion protein [Thermosulfurimonas sp. F29]|uniref:HlyD family secretion protein n=1 Tax=Thermosulfurimonas sp. F29 TaxID=2867247 RepID=UPI001C82D928|nr:HlyD family secretion protein [Thermosulfurimonas sp. F29]MBX6422559.1 HlyD family secretion protein [Thermosulfurimonas sp. F29]